jgi:hypothetical protein
VNTSINLFPAILVKRICGDRAYCQWRFYNEPSHSQLFLLGATDNLCHLDRRYFGLASDLAREVVMIAPVCNIFQAQLETNTAYERGLIPRFFQVLV